MLGKGRGFPGIAPPQLFGLYSQPGNCPGAWVVHKAQGLLEVESSSILGLAALSFFKCLVPTPSPPISPLPSLVSPHLHSHHGRGPGTSFVSTLIPLVLSIIYMLMIPKLTFLVTVSPLTPGIILYQKWHKDYSKVRISELLIDAERTYLSALI